MGKRELSRVAVVAVLLLSASCVYAGPGGWSNTGSLNTPRVGHTATLLENGRVLIIGGKDVNNNSVSPAELYNTSTGTFSVSGNLNTARSGHTATLLNDGRVLVIGGYNNVSGYLASAELYNPTTGVFTVTGNLNTARSAHTATLLSNGMVLIAGGLNGSSSALNSAELFNPASGTFTPTGSLNAGRSGQTATRLNNGKVLIAAGDGPGRLANAELYDPTSATFAVTGSLNQARDNHSATLMNDGKVLIAGGEAGLGIPSALATTEVYDPVAGTFTVTGGLTRTRAGHTATLLTNGQVLIAAGFYTYRSGSFTFTAPLASADLYNPSTGTSAATGTASVARQGHTATLLGSGNCLVAGGSPFPNTAVAESYQPTGLTPSGLLSISLSPGSQSITLGAVVAFTATGNFNTGPQTLASAIWSSSNSSVGPVSSDNSNYGTVYGLASGSTTIKACTGTVCGSATVSVGAHSNLLIGAAPGAGGTFEKYDDSGTRLATGNLSSPRSMHSAILLKNGHIFVAGGISDETSWQIFDPNGTVLSSGLLHDGRSSSPATLLANGNVFLAGGVTGVPGVGSGTWEIHDPSGNLVAYGNLNDVRGSGAAAAGLPNGNVWISGGSLGSGSACDFEIRSSTGALVTSGSLLSCFPGAQVQLLNNGNVMLMGGDSAPGTYEIRTQTGSFVSTSSLVNAFNHGANSVVLNNGNVFIFGSCQVGREDEPDPKDPTNTIYSWSCGTIGAISTWEIRDQNGNFVSTGSLLDSRDGAGAVVLSNGNVFITGGNQALGAWEIRSPSGALVSQGSLFNGDGGGHTLTHF